MKNAIRTIVFHLTCIIIFAFIYFSFKSEFDSTNNNNIEILDFLLLSTTIQAGVGISGITPKTFITKITMILQQLIMISTHIFTIYFFTI